MQIDDPIRSEDYKYNSFCSMAGTNRALSSTHTQYCVQTFENIKLITHCCTATERARCLNPITPTTTTNDVSIIYVEPFPIIYRRRRFLYK